MNIIVLSAEDLVVGVSLDDRRAAHIRKILRKSVGDAVQAGLPDGTVGTARIESIEERVMRFTFERTGISPQLRPVGVVLGFPRPIQAGRILRDLSSLGVLEIVLSGSDLGEKSYLQSDFYAKREYDRSLLEGAEQAGNPRIPAVRTAWTLDRAMDALGDTYRSRIAFDPYRASQTIGQMPAPAPPTLLAIGSERGWTPRELDVLEANGFHMAKLGDRILKTETAAVAACAIMLGKLGLL